MAILRAEPLERIEIFYFSWLSLTLLRRQDEHGRAGGCCFITTKWRQKSSSPTWFLLTPKTGVPCSYWAGVEVLAPVASTNTVGWWNLLPARGDGGPAPYLASSDTALMGVFALRLC